jgi:hypothetical protein
VQQVAGEQQRDAAVPGERADQRKDLGDAFRIDRHGRLVENDDVRILD